MRIISGEAKGRALFAPSGQDTRPTSDKIRGSLFNIIGARVLDARVLDLFGGTGALALEALSRGAESAVIADNSHAAWQAIDRNARSVLKGDFEFRVQILRSDYRSAIGALEGRIFDLVFLDPPYRMTDLREVTAALRPLLAPDSLVVIEHKAGEMPAVGDGFEAADQRRYGAAGILMLTPREVETA